MTNIMSSDLYNLRKGKALHGVLLGLLAVILVTVVVIKIFGSDWFGNQLENNSGIIMTPGEIMDTQQDFQMLQEVMPKTGMEFMVLMCQELMQALVFFVLPFILVVFGSDYSAGTFRNLLSYHANRSKIYLTKLLTSMILSLSLMIMLAVVSLIIGLPAFGFGGIEGGSLSEFITGFVLSIPMLLAYVSIGHCLIACTKKVSTTIAFYILGTVVWALVVQVAAMIFPHISWIINLDILGETGSMFHYTSLSATEILVPVIFSALLIVGTTILGTYKYNKTDFDF